MQSPSFALSGPWPARAGLIIILALFCVPLYVGLDGWDQRNDEAIYSYAVDRILETGDWLTPRSIPTDEPFLEKPPLKFWMVAGAMKLGLLPIDDRGMRFLDAVFCSGAFIYVYFLARRLSGDLAALVAVFLLFEFEPFIFNHGIRGNQMEGPLILAYCGGMYHFVRWADGTVRVRAHALAVSGYFVFAFMTKFVAASFLPIVAAAALAIRPARWTSWRARWRDWVAPAALAVAAIAPWFIYQTVRAGSDVWHVMFGEHVFTRFAGTLAVTHLQPWSHYFTQTWLELGYSESRAIFVCGFVALAVRAWYRRDWLAQTLFLWWIVPLVLISLGTSKLFYYEYPFLPPLAIGAGLAGAQLVCVIAEYGRRLGVRLGLKSLSPEDQTTRRAGRYGRALAIAGGLCVAMAVWTLVTGSLTLEIGGVRLFRNSSVLRPLVVAIVLWHFAGLSRLSLQIAGVWVVTLLLPLSLYGRRVDRLSSIDHPLRTARDCALEVQHSGAPVAAGIFNASGDLHHGYYYYLRRLGPWITQQVARPDELQRRLEQPGEQMPIILAADDYARLGGNLIPQPSGAPSPPAVKAPGAIRLEHGLPPAITIGDVVVLLFPGPFQGCAARVAADGARYLRPVAPR